MKAHKEPISIHTARGAWGFYSLAIGPRGVAAYSFAGAAARAAEENVARRMGMETMSAAAKPAKPEGEAERVIELLERYFAGERVVFDVRLDHEDLPRFSRNVWRRTLAIPYGETRSYGQIADAIRAPGAARAVGNALGANPTPIIVPCHRVIRADGSPGGFTGGAGLKVRLLELENSGSLNCGLTIRKTR